MGGVLGDQIENVAVAASHLVIVKHHREKNRLLCFTDCMFFHVNAKLLRLTNILELYAGAENALL